jgi:hypothetical protein
MKFASSTRVIKPCANPSHSVDWPLGQLSRNCAAGFRIANPHFAIRAQMLPFLRGNAKQTKTDIEGSGKFLVGHCRLANYVTAATTNL